MVNKIERFDLTKIKTGDILVVQTKSWLANLIQRFQNLQNKEKTI